MTDVLDHWQTGPKRAYRVTLARRHDPVASGDHRFLTERGWKHVTGAMAAPDQRPYLTTGNSLLGFGAMVEPPKVDDDYRRGYLTGMIRGDALLTATRRARIGQAKSTGSVSHSPTWRRSTGRATILADFGVRNDARPFAAAQPDASRDDGDLAASPARLRRRITSDRLLAGRRPTGSGHAASSPASSTPRAAIPAAILRIANTARRHDQADRRRPDATWYPARRGTQAEPNGLSLRPSQRVAFRRGMRFLQLTDPAITRKRDISGHRDQERRPTQRGDRSRTSGSRSRCSTSPPGPATSSPMASSATTASPARRTSTSTSTRGTTSTRRSW